jgi:hypothetical protein
MSDFRDPLYRDSFNPMTGNVGYEPADRRNAGWGWIAGAVFLVIVLALAFGVGHEPGTRLASNAATPPSATHQPLGPPAAANPASPPAAPSLTPPPTPAPTPTPSQ